MPLLWIAFAALAAFAMLSLLSSERQRVLNDRERARLADEQAQAYAIAQAEAATKALEAATAEPPVVR